MQKNGSETLAFLQTLSEFNFGYRTALVILFTGDTSTENQRDLMKFLVKKRCFMKYLASWILTNRHCGFTLYFCA